MPGDCYNYKYSLSQASVVGAWRMPLNLKAAEGHSIGMLNGMKTAEDAMRWRGISRMARKMMLNIMNR